MVRRRFCSFGSAPARQALHQALLCQSSIVPSSPPASSSFEGYGRFAAPLRTGHMQTQPMELTILKRSAGYAAHCLSSGTGQAQLVS